jgi:small subunit ribosomal protein S16
MATVIRFARHGTKKKPFYKIVVQDHRSPRDGKFIEKVGSYDPSNNDAISLHRERFEYWVSTGAQLSDAVRKRTKGTLKQWGLGGETPAAEATAAPVAKKKTAKAPAKEA